ncbi:hypothetical protein [Ascidiimonas aurantiaca]|uniref:hypothetical protein n=1 Tax=Ascidiimonas aurantiaca TaxID=1685432 RepID=UPI0030ED1B03
MIKGEAVASAEPDGHTGSAKYEQRVGATRVFNPLYKNYFSLKTRSRARHKAASLMKQRFVAHSAIKKVAGERSRSREAKIFTDL